MAVVPTIPSRSADAQVAHGARVWMRVIAIDNDWLSCAHYDGTTTPSNINDTYVVAKPYKLRHIVANYDLLTTLTTTNAQEVIAGNGVVSETWRVTPLYEVGDDIMVMIVPGTDLEVGVGGNEVHLLDCNVDGKQWAVV